MLPKVWCDQADSTQILEREGRLPSLASVGQDLIVSDRFCTVEEWLDMSQKELRNLSEQSSIFESLFEDLNGQIRRIKESQESPRRPVLPAAPMSEMSDPDTQDLALTLVSFPPTPLFARRLFTDSNTSIAPERCSPEVKNSASPFRAQDDGQRRRNQADPCRHPAG